VTRALTAAAFCAVLAACGTTTPAAPIAPAVTTPSAAPSASAPPLHQIHDPGQVTGTLTGPCHTSDGGQLPDPNCTPGAYDPAQTAAVLCAPGYTTASYRPPSSQTTAFKYHVAELAYGQQNVTGELDHLVSLELGGANDATNLWVEAGSIPNPKDAVENALHRWVCAATGTEAQQRLTAAQQAIAANWMTAEQALGITG
jgi:hypothetical protein